MSKGRGRPRTRTAQEPRSITAQLPEGAEKFYVSLPILTDHPMSPKHTTPGCFITPKREPAE